MADNQGGYVRQAVLVRVMAAGKAPMPLPPYNTTGQSNVTDGSTTKITYAISSDRPLEKKKSAFES